MNSTSYEMISTAGQGVIGYSTSASYEMGMGYIYGLTGGNGCDCGVWGDVTGEGLVNPVDVVYMVNFVYKNINNLVPYVDCPYPVGDATCDSLVNPVDVVYFVNYVYKNIDNFCAYPCA